MRQRRLLLWRAVFAAALALVWMTVTENGKTKIYKWNPGYEEGAWNRTSYLSLRNARIIKEQGGFKAETKTESGLATYTFTTPLGNKIVANFTDDLAAGDTLTGTVELQPTGKSAAETAQSQDELNGCVIEVAQQPVPVTEKVITRTIPNEVTDELTKITLKYHGKEVARAELPVARQAPPAPTEIVLPTGGQQNKPITLTCPCATSQPSDYLKIGGTPLPELASSPRKKVFRNTSPTIGLTEIECMEHGIQRRGEFRNLGIRLSAPKTNLLRGERTTLEVLVSGLAGITQDVPLDLENRSPEIIGMEGGEQQHVMIHPSDVREGGLYRAQRALTGVQRGAFIITGTVRWAESNVGKADAAGNLTGHGPQTLRTFPDGYESCGPGCQSPTKKVDEAGTIWWVCTNQSACTTRGKGCGCHLFGAPKNKPDAPWEHKADPNNKWQEETGYEYHCSCMKKI